ncbi:C40 family peptidase [Cytophagales bacterium LB-30]|uniref:C40 family peptidase n=1 Tax=Shiella aurantiaca TaxID=3058365 RepID=A0ABT8F7X3_9BACT|nr:C40 family peptidase [Shiella aurantiaca]MDN4166493.1 C40 family peptidase [Shiella aurantiaca]
MHYWLLGIWMWYASGQAPSSPRIIHTERDFVQALSENLKGTPYRYGGKTPAKGFDCSGFVHYVYGQLGYQLANSARYQFKESQVVDRTMVTVGDLIFFKGRNTANAWAGHVGIITRLDSHNIYFIHASTERGIVEGSLNEAYYAKRFLGFRRVITHERSTFTLQILQAKSYNWQEQKR